MLMSVRFQQVASQLRSPAYLSFGSVRVAMACARRYLPAYGGFCAWGVAQEGPDHSSTSKVNRETIYYPGNYVTTLFVYSKYRMRFHLCCFRFIVEKVNILSVLFMGQIGRESRRSIR